jgi:hypothetical protein
MLVCPPEDHYVAEMFKLLECRAEGFEDLKLDALILSVNVSNRMHVEDRLVVHALSLVLKILISAHLPIHRVELASSFSAYCVSRMGKPSARLGI